MTKIKNESVSNLKKAWINADFPNGFCSIPRPLHPFFCCKGIHVFFRRINLLRRNPVFWRNEYSPLSDEYFLLLHTGYQTGRARRSFLRWQGQVQPNPLFFLISGNGEK